MDTYKFKFSIIIPVYNVEDYIEETLDSVINQTIGFKKNIQIILVNDGSPDHSEQICLRYKELYPDNIVYVKQENAGVSAARNTGIQYVEGKYVNFLDSDDKWELDAFAHIYKFFEKRQDKVDVVAARKRFFEARDDYHTLDYKFGKTKVVYLNLEYEMIQLDVTSSFIKAEVVKNHSFSTKLKYGEDAQFIISILLERCTLGIVAEALHYYRKRISETSALQNEMKSDSYYFDSPKYFHQDVMQQSIDKYGKVLDFVQYSVMYDLKWRIHKPVFNYLEGERFEAYKALIIESLKMIDDRILVRMKAMGVDYKIYALSLKHGYDVRKEVAYDHGRFFYQNICLLDTYTKRDTVTINFLDVKDGMLHLEGRIHVWLEAEEYQIKIETGKNCYEPEYYDLPLYDRVGLDGVIYHGRGFKIDIPLKEVKKELSFSLWYHDIYRKKVLFTIGKFGLIPSSIKDDKGNSTVLENGYACVGGYLFSLGEKSLKVQRSLKARRMKHELEYMKELRQKKIKGVIKYRLAYYLMKPFHKKKIWLISDRVNKANDNGEHLFAYAVKHANHHVAPYYVIEKESEDYNRMKKIGKVIAYNSFKYKMYFLLADKIISSHANEYVINAFEDKREVMKDLYHFDYVFLQHGVTKDDLSKWINKYNKNLKMIVTVGKPECQSMIDGDYYYEPNVPSLTGFPRHDRLLHMNQESGNQKRIMIIPTWRKSIKGSYDPVTGESIYSEYFKETEYFEFYNKLINDERLLKVMRECGYKGIFCLHPSHTKQFVDYEENDVFEVNKGYVDYQNEFAKNSLLVTDYSSVFFDFSFLKKPVVYSQFDKDSFFEGEHAYTKGYFDYETHGFGPVCTDLDSTVAAISDIIKRDCKLDSCYEQRIHDFYGHFDDKNSERVYQRILEIK